MLGVLVTGRLPQTDFVQLDETHFSIALQDAENVNHLAVFLTGQAPFPEGVGGGVYISWPGMAGWQLLGAISNEKPSVLFKISGLKRSAEVSMPGFGSAANVQCEVGVSLAPLSQLAQETPATGTQVSQLSQQTQFVNKMCENLFNYISSFSMSPSQLLQSASSEEAYVPLKAVQTWYTTFTRRLQENPNFWK